MGHNALDQIIYDMKKDNRKDRDRIFNVILDHYSNVGSASPYSGLVRRLNLGFRASGAEYGAFAGTFDTALNETLKASG